MNETLGFLGTIIIVTMGIGMVLQELSDIKKMLSVIADTLLAAEEPQRKEKS